MLEQCGTGGIPGDPDALRAAADMLGTNSRLNSDIASDIRSAAATILAGWSAPSAAGFEAFSAQAYAAAEALLELGPRAASPLRTYADALEAAQRAFRRAAEGAESAEGKLDSAERGSKAERVAEDDLAESRGAMGEAGQAALVANETAAQAIEALIGDIPVVPAGPAGRPPLDGVLNDYQVADDEMVNWEPPFPFSLATEPQLLTSTEAELLGTLSALNLRDLDGLRNDASSDAEERYPEPTVDRQQDGHQDAFRHAYGSALLAREFGPGFAGRFTTAHEGVPGNPAQREAMDLYNNEVGRRIAADNPDAEPDELADRVREALERGDLVVVDRDNDLAWSDQVPLHGHGNVEDEPPHAGGRPAEGAESGDYAGGTGS